MKKYIINGDIEINGDVSGTASNVVFYSKAQTLNDTQKEQARANIGASAPIKKVTDIPTNGNYLPNVLYVLSLDNTERTISLSPGGAGLASEYHLLLTIGATAPTIAWPNGLKWKGGEAPSIEANHIYEVSILETLAVCEDWGAAQ